MLLIVAVVVVQQCSACLMTKRLCAQILLGAGLFPSLPILKVCPDFRSPISLTDYP